MAATHAIHYLLVRDFLEPWAKKCGVSSSDWQLEVFTDLSCEGRQVRFARTKTPLEVQIFGTRFWCRATGDDRRDDTLFVFELHGLSAPPSKSLTTVEVDWRLSRGNQRMPPGQPITHVPCFEPRAAVSRDHRITLTPTSGLVTAISAIVRSWDQQAIQRVMPRPETPPHRLLETMRVKYRHRFISACLPIEEGERLILAGTRTPANATPIVALYQKFGVPLVESIRSQQPGSLDTALEALADLPPPVELSRLLCQCWIDAQPSERAARQALVAGWRGEADAPPPPVSAARADRPADVPRSDPLAEIPPSEVHTEARASAEAAHDDGRDEERDDEQDDDRDDEPARPSVPEALPPESPERVRAQLIALRGASLMLTRPKVFGFADSILQIGDALNQALSELPEHHAALRVRELLDQSAALCSEASGLFPSLEQIVLLTRDVEQAIERIAMLGELGTARGWLERVPDWEGLISVLGVATDPVLSELPTWFFRELLPSEPNRPDAVMGVLVDDRLRPSFDEALRWLQSMRAMDPVALAELRSVEPGTGETPLARLQSAVDVRTKQKQLRARFDALQSELGGWVAALWDGSELTKEELIHSLDEIHAQRADFISRAPHIRDDLVGAIVGATGLRDAHERIRDIEQIFRRLDDLVTDLPSLGAMRKAFAKMLPRSEAPASSDVMQRTAVELSHCVSEGGAVRAARLIARQAPQPSLYLTDIPFHIKSQRPRSAELLLAIEAPHLANRPADWRTMIERRSVKIEESAWFEAGGHWVAPLVLADVPVVRGRGDAPVGISLAISGEDARNGMYLERAEFNWPPPHYEMPSFDLPFSDTTSLEDMQKHPLGIQLHFEEVLQTIKNGRASFLVAAPRRFGKTTLLSALRASTDGASVVVVGPIRSSIHASVSDAFEEACKELGRQLGVYVSTDWKQAQPLPRGDTFDLARKAARDQGKTAIYLLFDEAQALFRRRGRETAERLKVLIETAWGISHPAMAPIRLGLVGQLHLPRMIQGQLEGMFAQTIQKLDIDTLQIQRLLQKSTRDIMQSTSDARQMLARVSRNLYILKLLLAEIRRTLIQEQRTWFLRTDVERAVTALIEQAIQTSSTQLVSYLRDALNGSYDLTLWQPVPAYLVAVAWAVALADAGEATPARLERTRELIEQWARQITPRSSVPIHRIEECLSDLHDLAVLDERDRFRSELLARYFERLGRGSFPLREDAERQAMQKLLVDVVTLPEAMEQIGSGGQATIYYSDSNEREEAIRVVELPTDASRVAFVETCYALKAIEGTRSRHTGYLSLPVVRQAGLALDGLSEGQGVRGAVKYDWVTGSDLSSRRNQLIDSTVIAIGRAMAEALTVLEQRRVVHRDIRLENIIIGQGGTPVLVDFGLARLVDHMTHTRLYDTEYLAPEVKADPPQWSSLSDVFALGVTLRNLRADRETATPLGRVLVAATEPDCAKRLTPARLASELAALSDRLDLESARKKVENVYRQKLQRFPARLRWAHDVGSAYLPDMIASTLGVFGEREVLLCAASFLDDLFAAWYIDQYPGQKPPHISSLDASQLPAALHVFCHNDIIATGFLRHGRAHREKQQRNIDHALHRLNLQGVQQPLTYLRRAVSAAAQKFEKAMQVQGVYDLVQGWLSEPRRR